MQFEVEQKFAVDRLERIAAALGQIGATQVDVLQQADRYYAHPQRDFSQTDEAVRIRQVGQQNYITYKGPKVDASTKTRHEAEVRLADGNDAFQAADDILSSLGFAAVATVRKQRTLWHLQFNDQHVEAALDSVEQLGPFVELEVICEATNGGGDDPAVRRAQAAIGQLADQLDLRESERRSYLELLLDA